MIASTNTVSHYPDLFTNVVFNDGHAGFAHSTGISFAIRVSREDEELSVLGFVVGM
jgi:hypothetical protein